MPSISKRGTEMPPSPIRKLVKYADAAEKAGKTVFKLNIGQPDIPTPQVALDAIKQYDEKVIEYSHSAGKESYRIGLANYYNGISEGITKDDLMVTTGGSEALLFAFTACFNPNENVIIPEPFYANYNGFAKSCGVKVRPIMATIDNGFALPPIEKFEELIDKDTKGILICNPGNPTGYLYSQEELNQLRDIVKKHDLFLFVDEVYREFCYDGKSHFSVLNLEGVEDNVVVVDSVSKRYSMCGVRIGALVSRNKAIMDTAMKLAQARLSPPALGQVASEAALNTPESYFTEVREDYVARRNALVEGLNAIEGVFCPSPSGAFYCMAQLPVKSSEAFCQWMLEHFDLNGETLMMAPASGFYSSPERGTNEVRLAYVLEISKLKKAIACLAAGLEKYRHEVEN